MSSRDESIPIGTVSAEQIKQAREGAAALDLASIEERHARFEVMPCAARALPDSSRQAIHADRAWLLAALREERAKVERLRAALEPFVKEKAASLALAATREILNAPPAPRVTVDRSRPPADGLRFTIEAPPGTLASLPADDCDGSDQ